MRSSYVSLFLGSTLVAGAIVVGCSSSNGGTTGDDTDGGLVAEGGTDAGVKKDAKAPPPETPSSEKRSTPSCSATSARSEGQSTSPASRSLLVATNV